MAQRGIVPTDDPGRAVAFFLRVDAAALAGLGSQPLAPTLLRGSVAAAIAMCLTFLLLTVSIWIVLGGLGMDVSIGRVLVAGIAPMVVAWLGVLVSLPLVRALTPQLPGLAALSTYAIPGAALLSMLFIWAGRERMAITVAWGEATRPWMLTDLQVLLGREELLWAVGFGSVLVALLIAIPLWLRVWLRFSPPAGSGGRPSGAAETDLLAFHDRIRAARVEADEFSQRPRSDLPALAGRDDISVVERNRTRRLPTWLAATAGANAVLGRPALVLFLVCLLTRAFLGDPGLERFPNNQSAVFLLNGAQSVRTLTVPLGPEISGARLYALSGSGVVDIFVPAVFGREPESFSFLRAEQAALPPRYDIDLAGRDGGRGEIVLRNRWPGSVRLEMRVLQQFSDQEFAQSMVLAIANALLIVSGAVLVVLGFTNFRSYLAS